MKSNYLNSSNLPLITIKPETKNSSGYSEWNNSTSNSGYSGGISYSSQEQHIQSVNTALGGNVLGGAYNDQRKKRDIDDGINYQVKGIVQNLNYYGFKDPKGIVLSDCALEDKDTYVLFQTLQLYPFNLTILDLSNNKLGYSTTSYSAVDEIFWRMRETKAGETSYICKQIRSINLSNNLINDEGAKYIAKSLENGLHPSLKYLDVSGNQITQKGHISFMEALESSNVKSVMITLIHNTLTVYDKINQAAQSTIDFTTKFLKYSIEQHNQGLKGTKWDGSTVRTDDLNKWKNCKDVGTNVGMGFLGGLIKCATKTGGNPYAMFLCASKDAAIGLLEPDTFGCIVEVNKFVEDVSLTGDCTIF